MKKISIEKLELLNGGDKSFIAGLCTGTALVRMGASLGLFALTPLAGGALLAISGGCIAYSIYSHWD